MTVVASKYARKPNDKYETEEWATEALIRALNRLNIWSSATVWEPAAGNHKIVDALKRAGVQSVITSDICNYDTIHTALFDFLGGRNPRFVDKEFDLITNPPYGKGNRKAVAFAERALDLCDGYIALLLTAKFDFAKTRQHLFSQNSRFIGKVALLDRISWEDNGKTGTEGKRPLTPYSSRAAAHQSC